MYMMLHDVTMTTMMIIGNVRTCRQYADTMPTVSLQKGSRQTTCRQHVVCPCRSPTCRLPTCRLPTCLCVVILEQIASTTLATFPTKDIDKMMHGPCEVGYNAHLAYRTRDSNLTCSKQFPKSFNPSTLFVDDSYPMYCRCAPDNPSGGGHVGYKFIGGQKRRVDTRWVVPYSPYLLLKYGCHCNLEYCNNMHSVK